ncbi:MAG: nucleoside-diphosphate kinase [Spirochaeta sp. LUC14_002_19_P3]|nr:MAG: nucleoside-diphosphate kinase [Spirochaeta sp. LUC14_002_19_P3]
MAEELSYVITTPHTLVKSRTGGILSRLFSRVDLDLVAAQVFTPDYETVDAYAKSVVKHDKSDLPERTQLLNQYIRNSMMPGSNRPHRVALFLFRGENAVSQLMDHVGAIFPENRTVELLTGETIRDTYADLVRDENGNIIYFEPAVLTPRSRQSAEENLRIFTSFMKKQNNVVSNLNYPNPQKIQKTLVIIKPDNWKARSIRPGSIIDMFSRTGLRIVGMKVYQMSPAEALDFYGAVLKVLEKKVAPEASRRAVEILEKEFSLTLEADYRAELSESFGKAYSRHEFNRIIEFMSGLRPDGLSKAGMEKPGTVKSMCLVYEGVNAVQAIRNVLGPTDPLSAPGGTIRRDFGSNVMVNAVHASDSPENAEREFNIVKIHENNLTNLVEEFYSWKK